jgi:hypothetical protein
MSRLLSAADGWLSGSRIVASVCLIAALFPDPAPAQRRQRRPSMVRCTTASQCVSLGVFYMNNDDVSDRAADHFRVVVTKYGDSPDAERAQYFLGSYYQRKFYIQRQRNRRQDAALLHSARAEYEKYARYYAMKGSGKWLGDAYFGAALTAVELGDVAAAKTFAERMQDVAARDSSVYVYQVVWSRDRRDIVDDYIDTRALAAQVQALAGSPADQFISDLTKWCQTQSARRMAK